MIGKIRHKGLAALHRDGETRGVQQSLVKWLRFILGLLDQAQTIDDLNVLGLKFHALKGDLKSFYAVSVSGNWRIIFRFNGLHADDIELIDYH